MEYQLRKNIHFCSADGRLVFLDLERDRYFCLSAKLENAFRAWIGGETSDCLDGSDLQSLLERHILSKTPFGKFPQAAKIKTPTRSVIDGYDIKSNIIDTTLAIRERLHCRELLKKRSLLAVIASMTEALADPLISINADPKILTTAMAFEASSTWLAAQDQCLERSVALVRLLSRRRLRTQLVLGVTMNPFRAHAWAQCDDLVLNDTVAKVSNYTPILVI